MSRQNWLTVDLDGLRKAIGRRGKAFAVFELWQNGADESVTRIDISFPPPRRGLSELRVTDDSPTGFRNLADAYTLFAESYKKSDPERRGLWNAGEKLVLSLCNHASIETTTGRVEFGPGGRRVSRKKRATGSEFRGEVPLTLEEWKDVRDKVRMLIPTVPTFFNGEEIPFRTPVLSWNAVLPTVKSDSEGNVRTTTRKTSISVYAPEDGETPMLYEMGIPVVEIGCKYHVSIGQKVLLNIERNNVTPSYLKSVLVEVLNHTAGNLEAGDANTDWVRAAASDPRCSDGSIGRVLDLRFGSDRVSFDMNDAGSNREAASRSWTVVTGGSMSGGEWLNARRAQAILPAGQVFPTNLPSRVPDQTYDRSQWTPEMARYAAFVECVSPHLVGYRISVDYIRDPAMVTGCFHSPSFTVNLAHHQLSDPVASIALMLHELSHHFVKSNDHLSHSFYEAVSNLGARLAVYLLSTSHHSTQDRQPLDGLLGTLDKS